MAISRVKGKPSLFITKTLNVKCPEVQALLREGENPYDRPDVLVCVFELKRNKFMKLILGEKGVPGIFGKVVAHVAVVEFQKEVSEDYLDSNKTDSICLANSHQHRCTTHTRSFVDRRF